MTDLYQHAAAVIAQFEGFQPTAAWDVNAYRLGYGSDTEGPEQRHVVKGMSTTKDRALANLAARIPQYEAAIVGQVTQPSWDRLSGNAKAALLSFAYNYGTLSPGLASCVRMGLGPAAIAVAIEARKGDNKGINAGRRMAESALARTPDAVPATTASKPDLTTLPGVLAALDKLGFADPVKAFQSRHGLVADGDAGPKTQAAIAKALAS